MLSGAGDAGRAAAAMASVERHLIVRDDALALLFAPPFDRTKHDPGYIKGYPPGLRENGGQYSHAAMWAVLAFAKLGATDKAVELFSLLNPINHALTRSAVDRYKVEPYVVAADVYSVAPHAGRGGWTWYTGSAAWMYRAGIEGILGITREGKTLVLKPRIPSSWPGFAVTIRQGAAHYEITVERDASGGGRVVHASLDGVALAAGDEGFRVPIDDGKHSVLISV